jgi:hypothetical protein
VVASHEPMFGFHELASGRTMRGARSLQAPVRAVVQRLRLQPAAD